MTDGEQKSLHYNSLDDKPNGKRSNVSLMNRKHLIFLDSTSACCYDVHNAKIPHRILGHNCIFAISNLCRWAES